MCTRGADAREVIPCAQGIEQFAERRAMEDLIRALDEQQPAYTKASPCGHEQCRTHVMAVRLPETFGSENRN